MGVSNVGPIVELRNLQQDQRSITTQSTNRSDFRMRKLCLSRNKRLTIQGLSLEEWVAPCDDVDVILRDTLRAEEACRLRRAADLSAARVRRTDIFDSL